MVIPESIKTEYPFRPKTYGLKSGHNMNYVDEGSGEVLVCLHGNPTWSFYYRHVVTRLKDKYRVIVPDHIGCGLSDKPQDYSYRLNDHIENVTALLNHLGVEKFSLLVHDWGGAIGFGLATRMKERVQKIVALNTAAYTCDYIPWQINLCKTPVIGERAIRMFNGFAWPATFMAVTKPMPKHVKQGFLLPYNNYKNRIATARFVKDIPMNSSHPSYHTLFEIEQGLDKLTMPKLFLWGRKDFCFNDYFLNRWQKIYPKAEYKVYEKAGHYVLEDERDEVISSIENFL
jgi:haloalkane dehalogenase